MEILANLIVLAILVESVVEVVKKIYDDNKVNVDSIVSILIGLTIAFTTRVDILDMLGINVINNVVGVVLSGLLISRGGNYIHDLISKLDGDM